MSGGSKQELSASASDLLGCKLRMPFLQPLINSGIFSQNVYFELLFFKVIEKHIIKFLVVRIIYKLKLRREDVCLEWILNSGIACYTAYKTVYTHSTLKFSEWEKHNYSI